LIIELILLFITPLAIYKILRAWTIDKALAALIAFFFTTFLLTFITYFFLSLGILVVFSTSIMGYRFVLKRRRQTKTWT
jgi:hypothetical protein